MLSSFPDSVIFQRQCYFSSDSVSFSSDSVRFSSDSVGFYIDSYEFKFLHKSRTFFLDYKSLSLDPKAK